MASASFSGFKVDFFTASGTSKVGYLTVISLWKLVIPAGETLVKSRGISSARVIYDSPACLTDLALWAGDQLGPAVGPLLSEHPSSRQSKPEWSSRQLTRAASGVNG